MYKKKVTNFCKLSNTDAFSILSTIKASLNHNKMHTLISEMRSDFQIYTFQGYKISKIMIFLLLYVINCFRTFLQSYFSLNIASFTSTLHNVIAI